MQVTVSLEQRFDRTPDGAVWTDSNFDRSFWDAYLCAFGGVRVVARVRDVAMPVQAAKRADGDSVSFAALPYYIGPAEYAQRMLALRLAIKHIARSAEAFVLRMPSPAGSAIAARLRRAGRPYAVEVVGDPWDLFAPGANNSLVRPLVRRWFTRDQQQACAGACAASYVTEHALQARYRCPGYTVSISSIRLDPSRIRATPRMFDRPATRLICVGGFEGLQKAQDVLVQAVGSLVRRGAELSLTFVGDGRRRREVETSPAARELGNRVEFVGALPPGDPVIRALDAADVFVLPSRQEGLPRAMIEAMARGLPCIGSTVGGMGELLPSEFLVAPGVVQNLAEVIARVVRDPLLLTEMSKRNVQVASRYTATVLGPRRAKFYAFVRDAVLRSHAR
jgi:glycosyltransferase involved in cell wall biosynthesis